MARVNNILGHPVYIVLYKVWLTLKKSSDPST